MALLVIASGLYRLLAHKMRGYADAQARVIFRDLIDMPATVDITDSEVQVRFHRRVHLPIVLASGLLNAQVAVPWWKRAAVASDSLRPRFGLCAIRARGKSG